MTQDAVIACWQHHEVEGGESVILPDGCRDILVLQRPSAATTCFLTELATAPHLSRAVVGTQFFGFRLRPGTILNSHSVQLVAEIAGDLQRQQERIEDLAEHCALTDDCLACFEQTNGSVEEVAAAVGLSVRSMQRLLRASTGQPPSFWRLLSRARQCARALLFDRDLAQHAFDFGYADQSHMNREFKRWFGLPPSALLKQADLQQQLNSKAFA